MLPADCSVHSMAAKGLQLKAPFVYRQTCPLCPSSLPLSTVVDALLQHFYDAAALNCVGEAVLR